jgi:hypothetical protein
MVLYLQAYVTELDLLVATALAVEGEFIRSPSAMTSARLPFPTATLYLSLLSGTRSSFEAFLSRLDQNSRVRISRRAAREGKPPRRTCSGWG